MGRTRILSAEEIRAAEKRADENGLSYYLMMENAGKGCAAKIAASADPDGEIVILCGKGRNGGDGFVIARYLCSAGFRVSVIRMFDEPSDDLSEQMAEILPDGVTQYNYLSHRYDSLKAIAGAAVLVDAVFGIGFRGELPEYIAELFSHYPDYPAVKIAVDVPSGLSAANGSCRGSYRADRTLSMLCFKKEHVYMPWKAYCGKTEIVSIGFRLDDKSGRSSFTEKEAAAALPPRPYGSHKGTYGHALIVAGSRFMPGAAMLAAQGALNAGAGLVTLAFPDCIYGAVTAQLKENLMLPLNTAPDGSIAAENAAALAERFSRYTAAAVGCGLTVSEEPAAVLETLIRQYPGTLVVDADGINLFAAHKLKANGEKPWIFTPHPGEIARLTGKTAAEINADREGTARVFAKQTGVTLLLKGANTLVASPDGRLYVNPTGTPAMARGGSGDLLAGVIGALLAQGTEPFAAACLGAYFHGLAGNTAEARFGPYAATVSRIADALFQ